MSTVESNKVVQLVFKLKNAKGETLDEAGEKSPLVYLHGAGALPAGIEKQLNGMAAGDKKDAHLTAADAFGVRDEKRIEKVGRHHFGAKARFKVGDVLRLETEEGVKEATVLAMTPVTVTLDFNHPLAGQELDVSLHVLAARDATDEEKAHGHAHGWEGKPHNAGGHDHSHDHEGHDHDHDHAAHDHAAHDHAAHDHAAHDHSGHDHSHDHQGHDHSHGHDQGAAKKR